MPAPNPIPPSSNKMVVKMRNGRWRWCNADVESAQKPAYQSMTVYQPNGRMMAGASPAVHQKTIPRKLNQINPIPKMAVWLMKNAPPSSSPPPASHMPHVRRSALRSTVNPSQISKMALKKETDSTAQLRKMLSIMGNCQWSIVLSITHISSRTWKSCKLLAFVTTRSELNYVF